MESNIVQFSSIQARRGPEAGPERLAEGIKTRREIRQERNANSVPLTETAANSRLRIARRDAWWLAERVTGYWRARLDWHHALGTAQRYGIADSGSFPSAENESRFGPIDTWREAVAKQLLTPAPDLRAITWKRAKLKSGDFPHLPVKKERVERAIADDEAFLAAHPTRRSKSEPGS